MKKKSLIFILFFLFSIVIFSKNIENKFYKRIVSLTLSGDEMLLGLVTENRIVGLSGKINEDKDFSYVVSQAKKFPKVESNVEKLIELEPDLVIAADWMKKDILSQIEDVVSELYIYDTPDNFEEQKKLIKDLGLILKTEKKADEIVDNMEKRLKTVQEKIKSSNNIKKPKILLYTSYETTAGKGTTFENMIELIGGINLASEVGIEGSQKISKEKLIEMDPDIIVVPIWQKDESEKFTKFFIEDSSFKNLKAIKNKKVIVVPYAVTTPTSQYIIDGIEILAQKIYDL